jgi:single stranded DNA-binding protein
MASENLVLLMGNLTHDPILRQTHKGTPVTHFRLATNRRTSMGETPTYVNITCWGIQATTVAENKRKGDLVIVRGYLSNDRHPGTQGEARDELIVTAERVQFLPGRRRGAAVPSGAAVVADAERVPF